MAEFTQAELLNELSNLFDTQVGTPSVNGVQDPVTDFSRQKDIAALIFLLNPRAIYYLAKLSRNALNVLVQQEVAVIEDMLVALEHLRQAAGNTSQNLRLRGQTALSDAVTQLLDLEAASSPRGRPELDRFAQLMDRFVFTLTPNVSAVGSTIVMPRGEARLNLRTNLETLKVLHSKVVESVALLENLIVEYTQADIPSLVASGVYSRVRALLEAIIDGIDENDDETLIGASRNLLLQGLSSKVAVSLASSFESPDPNAPLASSGDGFFAQAAGEGIPAFLLSSPGPWRVDDLTQFTFSLKVDGAAAQTATFDDIVGPGILSDNAGPYRLLPPDLTVPPQEPSELLPRNILHFVLDSNTYEFEVDQANIVESGAGADDIGLGLTVNRWRTTGTTKGDQRASLGFKHLGMPLFITDFDNYGVYSSTVTVFTGVNANGLLYDEIVSNLGARDDAFPRVIVELARLATSVSLSYDASTGWYTVSGHSMQDWYVGFYFKLSNTQRYEIVEVIDSSTVRIDTRGASSLLDSTTPDLHGTPQDYSQFYTSPELPWPTPSLDGGAESKELAFAPPGITSLSTDDAPNEFGTGDIEILIGPCEKRAVLTAGAIRSSAIMVSEINAESSTPFSDSHPFVDAGFFVKAKVRSDGKIVVESRSRFKQELAVASASIVLDKDTPTEPVFIEDTAEEPLGLKNKAIEDGEDAFITPSELEEILSDAIPNVDIEVLRTDVVSGTLTTNAQSTVVEDSSTDFAALGVGEGYQVEIIDGEAAGVYVISNATGSQLDLNTGFNFQADEADLEYTVFTEQVRVASQTKGLGSSLKVTSQPTQFGFSTSITYGIAPQVEAVNGAGENLQMDVSPGDNFDSPATGTLKVTDSDGTLLTLDGGVSTGLSGMPFTVSGEAERLYAEMRDALGTFQRSKNLLQLNNYDENLDYVDTVLAALATPGQGFTSNLNRARDALLDLMSILTDSPSRADEYSFTPLTAPLNLEDIIAEYNAPTVPALDDLLGSYQERSYDRAVSVLVQGRILEFFGLTASGASYSGAVLEAARKVIGNLPPSSQLQVVVEDTTQTADEERFDGIDSDTTTEDTDGDRLTDFDG